MKEKLTISEMAAMRGLTAETLRHYDRIGLFKPAHVDAATGYRYYSIFQYEVLGTIKELRQIGMSTDEVKKFFAERNLRNSRNLLLAKHAELAEKLLEMAALERNVREKLAFLEQVIQERDRGESGITLRRIERRTLLTLGEAINSNLELSYGVIRLENLLTEKAPILASNRLGVILRKDNLLARRFEEPSVIFVVTKTSEPAHRHHLLDIPEGLFACTRYYGELWKRAPALTELFAFLEQDGYRIAGDALQIMQVDITVTDNPHEVMFELQVPVERRG